MKRSSKIVLISSALLVAIGIACIVGGVVNGGLHKLTVGDMQMVSPQDVQRETYDMGAFDNIDIEAKNFAVQIKRTDEYSIEIECIDEKPRVETVKGDDKKTTLTINGMEMSKNEIIVKSGSHDGTGLGNYVPVITIGIPKDKSLNDVSIDTQYGDIEVGDIEINKFAANISGDLDFVGTKLNSLDIMTSDADIDGKDIAIHKSTNIQADYGDVELEGNILGEVKIKGSGVDVDLALKAKESEYAYTLDANYGEIEIDDKEVGNPVEKKKGKNKLDISSGDGDIEIYFGGIMPHFDRHYDDDDNEMDD